MPPIGAWFGVDCHTIEIGGRYFRLLRDVTYRMCGKSSTVFVAREALFFGGGKHPTVAQQACCRIGMEGVATENKHCPISFVLFDVGQFAPQWRDHYRQFGDQPLQCMGQAMRAVEHRAAPK